jgi:hypothetical protein
LSKNFGLPGVEVGLLANLRRPDDDAADGVVVLLVGEGGRLDAASHEQVVRIHAGGLLVLLDCWFLVPAPLGAGV